MDRKNNNYGDLDFEVGSLTQKLSVLHKANLQLSNSAGADQNLKLGRLIFPFFLSPFFSSPLFLLSLLSFMVGKCWVSFWRSSQSSGTQGE